jgi:hypothetical protein
MDLGNQLDASAALRLGNKIPVPFTKEGEWALRAGLGRVEVGNFSCLCRELD